MVLRPELAEEWGAFLDLHGQRRSGGGLGGPEPISAADVVAWMEAHGVEGEEREVLWSAVRALDGEWLAWVRSRDEGSREVRPARGAAPRGA